MIQPWVKWLIKHNLKFVVVITWFIILPAYWFVYIKQSMEDAIYDLEQIKNTKKVDL
jgi:ABC-type uncharacterized transport system permease subunit